MNEILTPKQWNELRIQLKQKHPELTDADLPYYEAEEEDMLCMIEYELQMYHEKMPHTNNAISHYSR